MTALVLVKQDAHGFLLTRVAFSVGVHKLIAVITMQINPSFHCNHFVQEISQKMA